MWAEEKDASDKIQTRTSFWPEGSWVDRIDKLISLSIIKRTLPLPLEVALSVPGTWFGAPTMSMWSMPFLVGCISEHAASGSLGWVSTTTSLAIGSALLYHARAISESLRLKAACDGDTLDKYKSSGLVKLYFVLPKVRASIALPLLFFPYVTSWILSNVGSKEASGAVCFYVTSWNIMALVVNVMKHVFLRPRPALWVPPTDRHLPQMRWMMAQPETNRTSFPSGDAGGSAVFAMVASLVGAPAIRIATLPAVFLCMYGRMYFLAHHVVDVVTGASIGAAVAASLPNIVGLAPHNFTWKQVFISQLLLLVGSRVIGRVLPAHEAKVLRGKKL